MIIVTLGLGLLAVPLNELAFLHDDLVDSLALLVDLGLGLALHLEIYRWSDLRQLRWIYLLGFLFHHLLLLDLHEADKKRVVGGPQAAGADGSVKQIL